MDEERAKRIEEKLDIILARTARAENSQNLFARALLVLREEMMSQNEDLVARLRRIEGVQESAAAFIEELKGKLDAAVAANDLTAVRAVVDEMDQKADAIASAIATPKADPAGGDASVQTAG